MSNDYKDSLDNWLAYARNLTDAQLANVRNQEEDRRKRYTEEAGADHPTARDSTAAVQACDLVARERGVHLD